MNFNVVYSNITSVTCSTDGFKIYLKQINYCLDFDGDNFHLNISCKCYVLRNNHYTKRLFLSNHCFFKNQRFLNMLLKLTHQITFNGFLFLCIISLSWNWIINRFLLTNRINLLTCFNCWNTDMPSMGIESLLDICYEWLKSTHRRNRTAINVLQLKRLFLFL